jgi:aminomethyltransferase
MGEGNGTEAKKTPLYDIHVASGGKIVPFAGYLLPVQYSGVIAEHLAVRTNAGIFDVSHMGEVIFSGADALSNLQNILTNDFSGMASGRVRYSLMCNDLGGIVDDLLVYKYNDEKYLVVINAANREKDVGWMKSHAFGNVSIKDISDDLAQIALQGPKSLDILKKLTDMADIPEKYYTFAEKTAVAGIECLISQTGYTGELGYEIYSDAKDAVPLWEAIIKAGVGLGLVPAGLGARDTLRFEAGMPLYGHEMDGTVTPFEADLGFGVRLSKESFIGKTALENRGNPGRVRVGLRMTGRGIARGDETVYAGDGAVGKTTSGSHCPYLKGAFAMALIDTAHSVIGTKLEVDVRGRKVEAEVTKIPFYTRQK